LQSRKVVLSALHRLPVVLISRTTQRKPAPAR
jgi:hypothetical protein